MSKNKATKRRKVWVNHSNDGSDGFHEECAYWSKQEALDQYSSSNVETAVPFIERLPGDVVLSREDVEARKHAAERLESWLTDMKMENDDEHDHIRHGCGEVGCVHPIKLAVALLRGGR